jgi:hypothetical protein
MKRLGEANTDFEHRIEAVILGIAAFDGAELRYELAASPVASPVHRATASDCVRIETGQGGPVFLKALQPDMTGHVDYARVAKASRLAAERGIAPALILDHADDGVLGFELLGVGWRHATMGDLNHGTAIDAVLAAKLRLHEGDLLGWRFDVFARVVELATAARRAGVALPDDLDWMLRNVALAQGAIEAAGYELRFCHNDGVASNVMLGPGGAVRLVDFDLAGDNDPWFDVAVLLNEAFAFATDRRAALERLTGTRDPRLFNRCELYAAADDLMWGLWGVLVASTSDRTGIEFFKYGQWRLLRCQIAMQATSFEESLRLL